MEEILEKHYKNIAGEYDYYLKYSPDFIRSLSTKMVEKLDIQPDDIFVDLGGGTGMYSIEMHRHVQLKQPSICVDAFQEMLNHIPSEATHIQPVCMDALAFSADGYAFSKVLMKEAVHHVKDRRQLFANIYNKLPQGGRLLLVHVPPVLQYPIFERALERARHWHACPDELESQLKETGFAVERDGLDYRHRIPKDKYLAQVGTRFMSVLHTFSDEEMEEGLREMRERYRDVEILEFIDHFDYLTAVKH